MDYKFYISVVEYDVETGVETTSRFIDLEEAFPGLRYKQMVGLNAIGAPKFYTESFAEEHCEEVYIQPDGVCAPQELTLTLYFFGMDSLSTEDEKYAHARNIMAVFDRLLLGHKVVWYDTARKRKVKMYLSAAKSVKTDKLRGEPYIEAEYKFQNVYDSTFTLENPIFQPVTL